MTDLISWNVNGIRAAHKKGLLEFIQGERAAGRGGIVCLQETKAEPDQLTEEVRDPAGYHAYFASAQKRGYSGVAIFSKIEPNDVRPLGIDEFDREGRTLIAEFDELTVINGYFPNSQAEGARLDYKLAYCDAILSESQRIVAGGGHVLVCGDFNIAHTEIDLARPRQNEGNPGYLPEERQWMTHYLGSGFVDTFRHVNPDPGNYSWWSYRAQARAKNIGWRLDYHVVDEGLIDRVTGASIRSEIYGSDHCPVTVAIGELS